MESSRNCAGCGVEKPGNAFSNSQWRKGPGVSRCSDCVSQNVRSSHNNIQDQQRHFTKRHEHEFVTPPDPTAEIQILWKIVNVKQLLAKKDNEGSKWSRKSKAVKLCLDKGEGQTAHSIPPSPGGTAIPAPPRAEKVIQCGVYLEIIEKDGGDIGEIGLYFQKAESSSKFQATFSFEVVLPDGSVKKHEKCDQKWMSFATASQAWGYRNFFTDFNFDEVGLHEIGDGGLILRARATILKDGWVPQQPSLSKHHNFKQEEELSIHSSVGLAMFEHAEFSDISLVCQEEQTFKCHKAVLAAWSPVFKAMFSHPDMAEGRTHEVIIQDLEPCAMEALLRFMYCGRLQCEPGDELDLLAAAHKYNVQPVKQLCEVRLVDSLEGNPSAVPQVLSFTSLHDDLHCLHFAALQSLNDNRSEVMSSEGWATLCQQSPLVALEALNRAHQNFDQNETSCECWKK